MKKLKDILLKPSFGFLIFIYITTFLICSSAIIIAIINSTNIIISIISYILYAFAAITLGYSIYTIIIRYSLIKDKIISKIKKHKFGKKLLEQYNFRTLVFATTSTILNILFVTVHIVFAFITDAFLWYISLASYYTLLFVLRGIIILYHKKYKDQSYDFNIELKKYRFCGIVLTFVPLTLLIPILQVYYLDKAFKHGEIVSIAVAAYAFYKITMAIVNVVKSHKQKELTIQAIRNIGLTDALVSIFSLQTTLLSTFSEKGSGLEIMNIFTGSAVCILSILIGINMLFNIKRIKKSYHN